MSGVKRRQDMHRGPGFGRDSVAVSGAEVLKEAFVKGALRVQARVPRTMGASFTAPCQPRMTESLTR